MPCKPLCRLTLALALCLLCGCLRLSPQPAPTPAPPPIDVPPIPRDNEVRFNVDIIGMNSETTLRKVRFATMHKGERRSVQNGEDLLRVGRYDEEVLTLPKVRASRDFHIVLDDGKGTTFDGYSNVTYECLRVDGTFTTMLLGGVLGMVATDGRLSSTFYIPLDSHGRYRAVTGRVEPAGVHFDPIQRTRVVAESERQYALRYLGKKGMQLEFQMREICGGSRPRVVSRQHIFVPLGTTQTEVAGHLFRIHTATPDFLDVTLLR
ncbi:hypothetical protein JCM16814_04250 [Desulfobaculum senezii]